MPNSNSVRDLKQQTGEKEHPGTPALKSPKSSVISLMEKDLRKKILIKKTVSASKFK